jgi:hypothetical protein
MADIINGKPVEAPVDQQRASRGEQLDEAAMELHLARSVVSAMHDVFSHADAGVAAESIASDSLSGVLYDVLMRIEKAEAIINQMPR